jgi:hypothetical protein
MRWMVPTISFRLFYGVLITGHGGGSCGKDRSHSLACEQAERALRDKKRRYWPSAAKSRLPQSRAMPPNITAIKPPETRSMELMTILRV